MIVTTVEFEMDLNLLISVRQTIELYSVYHQTVDKVSLVKTFKTGSNSIKISVSTMFKSYPLNNQARKISNIQGSNPRLNP